MTGPERWNPLRLGATAVFSVRLVYNTKRSGEFNLGGRRFLLRRVRFPRDPTVEWFVVDLIEHHDMAGASLEEIEPNLSRAVAAARFDPGRLRQAAGEYGARATAELVVRALKQAA